MSSSRVSGRILDADVDFVTGDHQPPLRQVLDVGELEPDDVLISRKILGDDTALQVEHQKLDVVVRLGQVGARPAHAPVAQRTDDRQQFLAGRRGEVLVPLLGRNLLLHQKAVGHQ